MPDATELVKAMKRAALDALESTKPVNVVFGTVESVSPLKINVEQKMILGKSQLVLSRNVTDFETKVTVEWESESALTTHKHSYEGTTESGGEDSHSHSYSGNTKTTNLKHTHDITGKKKIIIHNGLVVGDEVILVRQQGGQKYVVIDRIGVM